MPTATVKTTISTIGLETDETPTRYIPTDPMLETVFPPTNQFHDRILYDRMNGTYYDRYSDYPVSLADMKQFYNMPI